MTAMAMGIQRPHHGPHYMPQGPFGRIALRAMAGRGRHGGGPFFGPGGPGPMRGPGLDDIVFWRHFGPFGGRGGGPHGRRPKARRGDVRLAALLLLAEEPRNGYGIMQAIEERSGGMWRPSPGAVYPALQQLEDEGLVRAEEVDGRRTYHLTDAGRAYVAERPEGPAPWEIFNDTFTEQVKETGALVRDVAMAFGQVVHAGNAEQVAEARRILTETRRSLYRLLADGDDPQDEEAQGS